MTENPAAQPTARDSSDDPLTPLTREGARRLIDQAIEIRLQARVARHTNRRIEDGRAGVVRNGRLPAPELQAGHGPATVRFPAVVARSGAPKVLTDVDAQIRSEITRRLKKLGYLHVAVDLEGYSQGSMNRGLEGEY